MTPILFEIALYCYLRAMQLARSIVGSLYLAFWAAIIQLQGLAEM